MHFVTDGLGNPLYFRLSPGNLHDIKVAETLLRPFCLVGKTVIADKGYDSKDFVSYIASQGGSVVIPSRCRSKCRRDTDWHEYKERHLIENLFLKLKNYRRLATRYEKSASAFNAVVQLACMLIWLF